jgi:hypothetical protein
MESRLAGRKLPSRLICDIMGEAICGALNENPECPQAVEVAIEAWEEAAPVILELLSNRPPGLLDASSGARIDSAPVRWRSIIEEWQLALRTLRDAKGHLDMCELTQWYSSECGNATFAKWAEIIEASRSVNLLVKDMPRDATREADASTATNTRANKSEGDGAKSDAPPDEQAETIDATGLVTNPKDETAYRPATDVLRNHTPAAVAVTYKQFTAILERHPEIRRWIPRPQRLSVHLADWLDYVRKETRQVDKDGLLANQFEIEARKAEINRQRRK